MAVKVSFQKCTSAEWTALANVVNGRIYIVTITSSIVSLYRAVDTTKANCQLILANAICTKPMITGSEFRYYNASGTLVVVNMSDMTIGIDNSLSKTADLSIIKSRGTIGTAGTVTALQTTEAAATAAGIKIGHYYTVITAGTYNGVNAAVIDDAYVCTAMTDGVPTWSWWNHVGGTDPADVFMYQNGGSPYLQNGDTIAVALYKLQLQRSGDNQDLTTVKADVANLKNEMPTKMPYNGGSFVGPVFGSRDPQTAMELTTKRYVDSKTVSMLKMQTIQIDALATFNSLNNIAAGNAYRVSSANTLTLLANQYQGTLGTGGDNTALILPANKRIVVGDFYKVITAGTWGAISCAVNDYLKVTVTTATWAKAGTKTTQRGFLTVDGNDASYDTPLVTDVAGCYYYVLDAGTYGGMPCVAGDFLYCTGVTNGVPQYNMAGTKTSLSGVLSMKGAVSLSAGPSTGNQTNDYWYVSEAGTYNGVACVVGDFLYCTGVTMTYVKDNLQADNVIYASKGDVLLCTSTTYGETEDLVTWTVLQNNIDLANVFTTKGALLTETAGATGKTIAHSTVAVPLMYKYCGTLGTGGTVTALPGSGVAINDFYSVITAGTYGGVVCVIGDIVKATATTPTWAKDNAIQNDLMTAGSAADLGEYIRGIIVDGYGHTIGLIKGKITSDAYLDISDPSAIGDLQIKHITVTPSTSSPTQTLTFGGTFTAISGFTYDGAGHIASVATKTYTMPTETAISGLAANADGSKMLTNLTSIGHALTATYTSLIALTLTGWATTADVGSILAADTLKIALNRLQNRITQTESDICWVGE